MPSLIANPGNNGDRVGREAVTTTAGGAQPPRAADLLGALATAAMAHASDVPKQQEEIKDPVTPPLLKSEVRTVRLSIEDEKKDGYPSAPFLPTSHSKPRVSEVGGIYSGYPSYRPGYYPSPHYSLERPPFWSSYASAYGHPHAIPPAYPSYRPEQGALPPGIRRSSIPRNPSDSSDGDEPFTGSKSKLVSPPVASAAAPVLDSQVSARLSLSRKGSTKKKRVNPSSQAKAATPNKRRASMGKWSEEEDDLLRRAVKEFGGKCWKKIAARLKGRTDVQCLHRWQKVLRPGLVKGPWTPEEDAIVINLVKQNGTKKWSLIARQLNGRLGKQCRERW